MGVTILGLGLLQIARASDYGCTVLLCLSNPNGPEAVNECINPIEQLKQDLKNGKAFPGCEEAQGAAVAKLGSSLYDACPAGTSALPTGQYAVSAAQVAAQTTTQPYSGIGDGSTIRLNADTGLSSLPQEVCVGQQVGSISMQPGVASDNTVASVTVGVYDQVALIDPSASGGTVTVYVNGAVYRKVRL